MTDLLQHASCTHTATATYLSVRHILLSERRTNSSSTGRGVDFPGGRGGVGEFVRARVNLLRCFLFTVRSTTVLPQWHRKDPAVIPSNVQAACKATAEHAYAALTSEWAD